VGKGRLARVGLRPPPPVPGRPPPLGRGRAGHVGRIARHHLRGHRRQHPRRGRANLRPPEFKPASVQPRHSVFESWPFTVINRTSSDRRCRHRIDGPILRATCALTASTNPTQHRRRSRARAGTGGAASRLDRRGGLDDRHHRNERSLELPGWSGRGDERIRDRARDRIAGLTAPPRVGSRDVTPSSGDPIVGLRGWAQAHRPPLAAIASALATAWGDRGTRTRSRWENQSATLSSSPSARACEGRPTGTAGTDPRLRRCAHIL